MDILVKPEQLLRTATELRNSAKKISNGMASVDAIMREVGPAQFSGHQAEDIRRRFQSVRERLLNSHAQIIHFSAELENMAKAFAAEDRKLATGWFAWMGNGLFSSIQTEWRKIGPAILNILGSLGISWPPKISLFPNTDLPQPPWDPKPVNVPGNSADDLPAEQDDGSTPNVSDVVSGPVMSSKDSTITQRYHGDHLAIDIYAPEGTPINASFKGKVVFSNQVDCGRLESLPTIVEEKARTNYGFGNEIIVEYKFDDQPADVQKRWAEIYGVQPGQSIYALYGHLEQGKELLPVGTEVDATNPIATVGNTGHTTGTTGLHLHLSLQIGDSGLIKGTNDHGTTGWAKLDHFEDPSKMTEFLPG